jgi:hypothetical protein
MKTYGFSFAKSNFNVVFKNVKTLYSWMEDNFTLYTHSLTHSLMELSPSWEAANCAATQEILSFLWNPKVLHRYTNWIYLFLLESLIETLHHLEFTALCVSNVQQPPSLPLIKTQLQIKMINYWNINSLHLWKCLTYCTIKTFFFIMVR